ncbi:ParB/RepB/Spo0J family partition protein [Brevibacillus sp. 179-C8.5 HS]|uniref:ParB/RepB/Spo0J family partition protein n=5 Tax=unclassified Brevibacillus TaxID=2684853 RepID=UPI0039A2BF01
MLIREKVEYRRVEELREHPLNRMLNSPLGSMEAALLENSIDEMGIQEPLWVTGENVIISGHERWKIAKQKGMGEVPVRVVESVTEEEMLYLLVMANDARRGDEKDPMRKARKIKVLYDYWGITVGRPKKGHDDHNARKTRHDVANLVGEGERTARRLLRLLDLIPELQELVSRGVIGVVAGNELAALSEKEQCQLYEAITRSHVKEVRSQEIQAIRSELEYLRERRSQQVDLQEEQLDLLDMKEDVLAEMEEQDAADGGQKNELPEEDREWHTELEKEIPKTAIDAVAPTLEASSARNLRRRLLIKKLDKAEKLIERLEQDLLPFFDNLMDAVVRERVHDVARQLIRVSERLDGVVSGR